MKKAIRQYRPDIIHIHNLHYAIGPIAIRIAKRLGMPIVTTLHNYRLLCPSATLFHDGRLFTNSLHVPFPWKAIRLGVHSHSVSKTFWLAFTVWLHKKIGTWLLVDRYITLTDFAKQVFAGSSLGVPELKFVTKPNFVSNRVQVAEPRENHFLFIGRLTEEKGINVLLEAFSDTAMQLRIAGDGPLRDRVTTAAANSDNITYLGTLDRTGITEQLACCSALVFPSTWYEGMPITLIEAFSLGTPVIASDLGAMQAMVKEGKNGWRFPAGDAMALREIAERWLAAEEAYKQHIGAQAMQAYEQHYTAEKNKTQLLSIYQSLRT